MTNFPVIRGTIHGRMIELDRDSGFPEGQQVAVIVQPIAQSSSSGEGLKQSFGGWSEDAKELDEYLEWNRQQRKKSRSGL